MVALLVVVTAMLAAPLAAHADIVYLYDDLGRLARVIRPDGSAATYHYDAVGNILRITRETAVDQTTTITPPATTSGAQGSRVTITIAGTNLFGATLCSPNPGISFESIRSDGDSITFDVVIAPGAAVGLTSICVEGVTVVSTPFTVDQSNAPAPPTITGFSPTSGRVGDLVTVDGTGFDETTPANNVVRFNGVIATLQSATSSRLTARVPAGATTGPISATTPNGAVTSGGIFTITTAAVIATLEPPLAQPRDIVVRPDGTRAYVANGPRRDTISVVDTSTHSIVATIPVSGSELTVSPDGTRLYALTEDLSTGSMLVSVIDLATNAPLADVALTTVSAERLAMTPDGTALFVLDHDGALIVLETATNTEAATIPVPISFDGLLAVAPDGGRVYVTQPSVNAVTVVDVASRAVTATIPIGNNATGGVFSPIAARFYVSAEDGITVIDTSSSTVTTTIPDVRGALAINPAGTRLYATSSELSSTAPSGTVTVIDTTTDSVLTAVTVSEMRLDAPVVTPDGQRVVVPGGGVDLSRRNVLAVIDVATSTLADALLDGLLHEIVHANDWWPKRLWDQLVDPVHKDVAERAEKLAESVRERFQRERKKCR